MGNLIAIGTVFFSGFNHFVQGYSVGASGL
jgi:hypothetical protein